MNNKKLTTIVVLVILTFGISYVVPNVAGGGPENSLVERVRVLEEQVALLTERVEELEAGAGSGSCSCDVLHLTPLLYNPKDTLNHHHHYHGQKP